MIIQTIAEKSFTGTTEDKWVKDIVNHWECVEKAMKDYREGNYITLQKFIRDRQEEQHKKHLGRRTG